MKIQLQTNNEPKNVDITNPLENFELACWYYDQHQYASAISFFIRAAERAKNDLAYESLIHAADCYDHMGMRNISVRGLLDQAIALNPSRPEAYWKSSILLESSTHYPGHWIEAYKTAKIGYYVSDQNHEVFRRSIGYEGSWQLQFQIAHCGWQSGLTDEAFALFVELSKNLDLNDFYADLVHNNLINLGITNGAPFPTLLGNQRNYSEAWQDRFALEMGDNKTYLEIGAGHPIYGSNTYLLEKHGWTGIGLDLDDSFIDGHKKYRKNPVFKIDATTVDYKKLVDDAKYIDYLQVDCDPPEISYKALEQVLRSDISFGRVTFEHDKHTAGPVWQEKAFDLLVSHDYRRVKKDVTTFEGKSFEDWYEKSIDWGEIDHNQWFRGVVENEVLERNTYQKFRNVREGDVVVDIGTSVGPFPYMIKNSGFSKLYCIEPHEGLLKTLNKNLSEFNIEATVIPKALGKGGLISTSGLFSPDHKETREAEEVLVDSISFKDFINQNDIEKIDFLKIDCEGGEYDVFNRENKDWIKKNIRYAAGEWHLNTPELQQKFREFRDLYLKDLSIEVYSYDDVDIKHDLWTDWFIDHYDAVNIYIDFRQPRPFAIKPVEKWKYTQWPTLEVTTIIPKKGCVVDCVFCPQRVLVQEYKGDQRLTLDNFKLLLDKVPTAVRITFAGFTEPWLNKDTTKMALYAHEKGHPVSGFTTAVGMTPEDVRLLSTIPWAGGPNGGFTLHLPDEARQAKHPINDNFIATMKEFARLKDKFQNFSVMTMSNPVHHSVVDLFPDAPMYDMWSRAGNLFREQILKEELTKHKFKSIDHGNKEMTCGCEERVYHNILLPNGDVSLCCMDYGVEEILGNLYESDYNDCIPEPYATFDMCRKCENGVELSSDFIQNEMKSYGL